MSSTGTRKLRVGIVRCDLHAYYYAPFFEQPDPKRFREISETCHFYLYERNNPAQLRFPPAPDMTLAKLFDENDPVKAERLSWAFGGRPRVCKSLDEVSEDVDLVYIADCDLEGKDHLRYAMPGLKKGIPHFVDKPFAYTLKDARKMVGLAEKHDTPLMCASILRWCPYMERFRKHLADVGPVSRMDILGAGASLAGVFHAIGVSQNVMGYGCEWVESMGETLYDVMRLHYPRSEGGTEVLIFNEIGKIPRRIVFASTYHHCEIFWTSAYGAGGAIHAPRVGDYEYPYGAFRIIKMARRMAQTGKPPIPYAHILEFMEIIEACRIAHNKGKRVYLDELR